jgi:hypothetical protein
MELIRYPSKVRVTWYSSFKICHWLGTPVILATQEAEIRRTEVRSQPQANSLRDSYSKTPNTKIGLAEWLKW